MLSSADVALKFRKTCSSAIPNLKDIYAILLKTSFKRNLNSSGDILSHTHECHGQPSFSVGFNLIRCDCSIKPESTVLKRLLVDALLEAGEATAPGFELWTQETIDVALRSLQLLMI